MSLDPKEAPQSGHFHAVRFYENADALSRIVAEFLGEGFAQHLPAVVIATPEHRELIEVQLTARGFDVARLQLAGDMIVEDVDAALSQFMWDGTPDPTRFKELMIPLLDRAAGGTSRTVRAYGEMVDVLWRAGRTVAAVKLEMLWNELAQTHDFSLLCGYAMGNFYKSASVEEICAQHTHVVASHGEFGRVQ